jgi:hypothetical protein
MHVRHHASHAGHASSSHANSAHTNSWANSSANSWIRLKWQVGLRSLVQASALVLLSFLLGTVIAHPVRACTLTMDAFTYADGSSLNGQSGGNQGAGAVFTSDWATDLSTPTNGFLVQNGQVQVGDTGGTDYRVSRGMDLSGANHLGCPYGDPTCVSTPGAGAGTTYVYSQLAQVVDNHLAYEAAVEFSDAYGITAAFGIENDGVDNLVGGVVDHNDYFFAELGTTRVVSSFVVQPDTSYFVYGALSFNVDGGTDDVFKMWVNPTYSDFLNNINPTLEIAVDLDSLAGGASRTSLGNTMTMMANTQQAGTFKAFDDLQVARDSELLSAPRLDIGSGTVQTAFDEWAVGVTPQSDFTIDIDQQVYIPSQPAGIATLTLDAIDAAQSVVPEEDTFVVPGYDDALRADRVAAVGGVRLSFSGLHPDQYLVKTYHYQTSDNTPVDVYVSEDGGLNFAHYSTFTPAGGTDAARENMVFFENLSGDDIVVEFRPTVAGATVGISGLQFVPEPGTGLLVGLGLAGLGISRRRTLRGGQPASN